MPTLMPILSDFPDTPPCTCGGCKAACRRACWPTPEEAGRLLDGGFADRLMLDCWMAEAPLDRDTYLVCPATPGHEAALAPGLEDGDEGDSFFASLIFGFGGLNGGCVMQDEAGLCGLHGLGLKPAEGRKAGHGAQTEGNLHLAVAALWDSEEGRAVVARFCALVGLEIPAGAAGETPCAT